MTDVPQLVDGYIRALAASDWGNPAGYDITVKQMTVGKKTDYQVIPQPPTPISEVDKQEITRFFESVDYKKYSQPHTVEEVMMILNGQPLPSKNTTQKAATTTWPPPAAVPAQVNMPPAAPAPMYAPPPAAAPVAPPMQTYQQPGVTTYVGGSVPPPPAAPAAPAAPMTTAAWTPPPAPSAAAVNAVNDNLLNKFMPGAGTPPGIK